MKIYDVSMLVQEGMAVYQGNPSPRIEFVKRMPERGANESLLTLGAHTGTHMDAGLHCRPGGWMAHELDLRRVVGKCRVLDLTSVPFGCGIGERELKKFKIRKGEIIVLKTRNSARGFSGFKPDFVHVDLEGAEYLVRRGIAAIAIDSLGIQKFHSGNMKVHDALLRKKIPVFEGLNLKGVPAGRYFFVGLPLKLKAEGAPARVVLIKGIY
ncbi:Kynurenine formamidase [Candidatus Burarchaeum australiense]|nr:Kynurenine formamidase [Candidatus Burarchaeum australiense]